MPWVSGPRPGGWGHAGGIIRWWTRHSCEGGFSFSASVRSLRFPADWSASAVLILTWGCRGATRLALIRRSSTLLTQPGMVALRGGVCGEAEARRFESQRSAHQPRLGRLRRRRTPVGFGDCDRYDRRHPRRSTRLDSRLRPAKSPSQGGGSQLLSQDLTPTRRTAPIGARCRAHPAFRDGRLSLLIPLTDTSETSPGNPPWILTSGIPVPRRLRPGRLP